MHKELPTDTARGSDPRATRNEETSMDEHPKDTAVLVAYTPNQAIGKDRPHYSIGALADLKPVAKALAICGAQVWIQSTDRASHNLD